MPLSFCPDIERFAVGPTRLRVRTRLILISLWGQPALKNFPNSRFNFCNRSSRIDFLDSLWLGSRNRLITLRDSFEETAIGFFNAITHKRKCGLALEESVGCDFVWDDEKESDVWSRFTHGNIDDRFDHFEIQLTTVALVCCGGIVETIAYNNFSRIKGRADYFADELSPARIHEQQFRFRSHRCVVSAMLQSVANLLADRCAAGFANRADSITFKPQMFGKQRNLCGFAAPFGAFEADEKTGHQIVAGIRSMLKD